ncbi:hypothetical protein [Clostridium sp.]|uniref:hypothetical protein n=1 Tax=Clostridium sp. TaxID=1506 RepID=UPI0025BB192E|nr:hypothetical protein [Clostridium sp.]
MDFGFDGDGSSVNEQPLNGNNEENNITEIEGDTTTKNNDTVAEINENETNSETNNENNSNENNEENTNTEFELEPGTELRLDDKVYTVDDNGNVIDEKGKIFKEAKDVKSWLESFETQQANDDDEENTLNIKNLQKALDIAIVDENDNELEFENTLDGVASYVQQVIENSREENYQTAISTLFQQYPFIEDMINYYNANGNSLDGYNEVPDRSNVVIDENNQAQQEYIIRTAWKEQGKKGNVDSYIEYLKSTGNLYTTAQEELDGLKENDRLYREEVRQAAEQREKERTEQLEQYWGKVHEVIKSKQIAGYAIPESIVVNRNGQKTIASLDDFFNYIYQVDKDGKSRYNHDLEQESPEARLQDDILRAYLKFTGGNYTNLIDMAINNEKVNKLILKSKQNKKPSISVKKPTVNKNKDIDLGY